MIKFFENLQKKVNVNIFFKILHAMSQQHKVNPKRKQTFKKKI